MKTVLLLVLFVLILCGGRAAADARPPMDESVAVSLRTAAFAMG